MKYLLLISFFIFANPLFASRYSNEYCRKETQANVIYEYTPSYIKNKLNLKNGGNKGLEVIHYEMMDILKNAEYFKSLKSWFNNTATADVLQTLREHTILLKFTIDESGELYDISFIIRKGNEHILSEGFMNEIINVLNQHKCSFSNRTDNSERNWTRLSLGPSFWNIQE